MNARAFAWAAPPAWIGQVKDGRASLLLAFKRQDDLDFVLHQGVFLFGHALRARRFRDSGRPRPCSKCCSLEHSVRACPSGPVCALCAQGHVTSAHHCEQCDFFSSPRTPREVCAHTVLRCPHCAGPHSAGDRACRVFKPKKRVRRKRGGGPVTPPGDVEMS